MMRLRILDFCDTCISSQQLRGSQGCCVSITHCKELNGSYLISIFDTLKYNDNCRFCLNIIIILLIYKGLLPKLFYKVSVIFCGCTSKLCKDGSGRSGTHPPTCSRYTKHDETAYNANNIVTCNNVTPFCYQKSSIHYYGIYCTSAIYTIIMDA